MPEPKTHAWPRPPAEDEIRSVLARARGGDPAALSALRAVLNQHPEVWEQYGDLAAHARDAWIGLISGPDLALRESLGRKLEAMQVELAGPAHSPLEALLIERISVCWLEVSYCDVAVAQAGEVSIEQADFARKRQDSAHRRYLQAIATLATIRRLLPSAVTNASPEDLPAPRRRGRRSRSTAGSRRVGDEKCGTAAGDETLLAFRRSGEEDGPDESGATS